MKHLSVLFIFILGNMGAVSYASIEARAVYQIRVPPLAAPNSGSASGNDAALGSDIRAFKNCSVCLYLKNTGPDVIKVPTQVYLDDVYGYESQKESGLLIIPLNWEFPENPLGVRVVIAESRLGFVSLKPGETTAVEFSIQIDSIQISRIRLGYKVDKDFSDYYSLWSGNLLIDAEKR